MIRAALSDGRLDKTEFLSLEKNLAVLSREVDEAEAALERFRPLNLSRNR